MNFEEGLQVILDSLRANGTFRALNQAEILVLKASWENLRYKQVAGEKYSYGYLCGPVSSKLWAYLSDSFGRKVKKNTLRPFIEAHATSLGQDQHLTVPTERFHATIQGSQPPNVPSFYGREEDLNNLASALAQSRCVALTGAAGIGKSALASIYVQRTASKLQPDFQNMIWLSLHHGQTVDELLEPYLDRGQFDDAPLQESRCLLVIDCGSTELEEDINFQSIVQQFCVERHQSSLLIISRNVVKTVQQLDRGQRSAATIKLTGLADQDALRILKDQGIQGDSDCKKLIESYRGNPQLLLLAAERINRFCGGKLESFMLHKTSFASDYVRRVIREYRMQGLTPTEQRVLDILIQSDQDTPRWISFSELMTGLSSGTESASMSELIEILETWEGMSFIESGEDAKTGEATFTLPPTTRKVLIRSNLSAFASLSQPA